jgi:CRP-like cAMP-binding protein
MAVETNAELLGRVPIFQGLSPVQLMTIARYGTEVCFGEGTPILQAGNRGEAAFLILSGFVAPEQSFEAMFATDVMGYGTLLGELAMLVETTFTLTVIARWPVRALRLSRATMYGLMEEDPAIAHHFSGKLLERLRRLARDIRRADAHFAAIETSLEHTIAIAG